MTIMDTTIGRRTFLVGAGASGLIFGFAAHDGIRLADAATTEAFAPNLWFSMDAAGKTVIRIDKAEMGQHVGTALAQILADELEVKWSDISLHHIGFDPKVGLHVTGGSWSVNWTFDRMSRAGAAGRIALIEAAAKKWGVPADKLSAKDSVISGPGGKTISYAELVKAGVPPKSVLQGGDGRDQAEGAGPTALYRQEYAGARYSGQDERHRRIRHRCRARRHGLRHAGHAAGALRRQGEVGRRQCGEEDQGLP